MNWGKALALVMTAFAGMMAYFLVKAARNPEPLVTERYYEHELVYQQRIDATSQALSLSRPVIFDADRNGITVTFPPEVVEQDGSGELLLLRANNEQDDRALRIGQLERTPFTASVELKPGLYIAQLSWRSGKVDYYTEKRLIVP